MIGVTWPFESSKRCGRTSSQFERNEFYQENLVCMAAAGCRICPSPSVKSADHQSKQPPFLSAAGHGHLEGFRSRGGRALGGHLATIRNQTEEDWVFHTFGSYDGKQHLLWIGLSDTASKFNFSARLAFRELESFAAMRVRKQGCLTDRTTGNLVAASFVHDSSRTLDPQLHTHFTVFNATGEMAR